MTTLIVILIIAILFGAGVGLLVMEHVITQRRRRAFPGQLIGIRTGMQTMKTNVQDQMFANLDEPLTDLPTVNGGPFHGDPDHSCYDNAGNIVCVVAKVMLNNGPSWRELMRDSNE